MVKVKGVVVILVKAACWIRLGRSQLREKDSMVVFR